MGRIIRNLLVLSPKADNHFLPSHRV